MSSITLKLTSLIIKTLSKPIANRIKSQAREHARFRGICVSFAQGLHRVDMRLRLGLLQDPSAIERQAAREAAEAAARKRKLEAPTVKTEAEAKADEAQTASEKAKAAEKLKAASKPRIRPLSEAKAIDSGANFISESFLFLVAGALIVFESLRSRRKETSRREDVADRLGELEDSERNARKALVALEKEIIRLRHEEKKDVHQHVHRILPKEVWELADPEDEELEERTPSWVSWIQKLLSKREATQDEQGNSSTPSNQKHSTS